MNNKKQKTCNGYEAMYTFLNEEEFQKHIQVCEECAREHAKMQRVSELIQEAKPYITQERQKKTRILRTAAAFFVIAFATLSFPAYMAGVDVYDNLVAQNTLTVQEMGLPVDEYGFLCLE